MDNAKRSQSMDVGDVKDLLTDLVDVLQHDPKMLAVKRLIQCFNEMENNTENLLSTILEKLILAINTTIETILISDLNDLLYDLIDILQEESTGLAMKRVLQCIFNMILKRNVNLSSRIFKILISTMIAASANHVLASTEDHRQLVANILACVKLQVTKFPSAEDKLWLDQLWSLCLNGEKVHPFAGQILVQFIDNFVRDIGLDRCPELLSVIQQLLQSKDINDRQAAHFLMHQLEGIYSIINSVASAIKCPIQQWSDYISALESLEKHQMPLNLISLLENLKSSNDFLHWQRILYVRLLQSENILVVYETVKYIVTHLKMSDLTEWKLMEQFLVATNRTQLYNVDDGDNDRSSPLSNCFVTTSELESFFEALVNVPWKWQSVPLLEWLTNLPKEDEDRFSCISIKSLVNLASRVQRVKPKGLKNLAQDRVMQIFQITLDNLSLKDYLLFIRVMYHKSNNYSDHDRLEYKIIKCENFQMHIEYFNEALWHIIFNQRIEEYEIISALIEKLEMLPKDQHGYLQHLIISEATSRGSQQMYDFYYTEYDVDIALLLHGDNLTELCSHLIDKLMWTTDEEVEFIVKLSTEIFVHNQIKKWSDIKKFGLKPLDLLNQGGI
ncbi:uncharacterized protein [Drosophila tropicalis]|uniref:uncharacterized protein n=1 Tax=Drosophila tropicalis TaxID=46794 RepID=UPI0035AB96C1